MDPIMCANGCGFFGSVENRNLCSKCYNDFLKSEIIAKTVLSSAESTSIAAEKDATVSDLTTSMEGLTVENVKKRCKKCNKKVGLTGFKCRCDGLFCARHRLPEEHSCDSDYKTYNPCDAQGNPRLPLIKADKLKWRA